MFDTVLVANRGEIACRVLRTLRTMGIRSVAVFSDADAGAPHVRAADTAVRIGPAAAARSYLSVPAVIAAARATGAQAIHPGYGFLSENTAFAAACEEAGIVFVGPPSSAIEEMGDKIRAKQTVAKAGVPVVPGWDGDRDGPGAHVDDRTFAAAVREVGYPVLLKPSAGGGGKGMREVRHADDLLEAVASARREARGAFGDDTLLVERLVEGPRHIEIQVVADTHGNVVHFGERECSLQRRHQKIIEEAPSPLLTDARRAAMGAAAVEAARAVGYVGAGTVEFIVGAERPDHFFMEMNTRLQVEHPVTEEIYPGLDLVEVQLRVAAGERAPWPANRPRGHAVEARIYAEDPAAGFLPTGGRILALHLPPDVRVDAGIAEGGIVGSDYDPMLAKVIAWGPDREQALAKLDGALRTTVLLGVGTNIGFLRALLADPDVRAGRLSTELVGRRIDALTATEGRGAELPADVLPAAAVHALAALEPTGAVVDPFDVPGGWRVGAPAWTTWRMAVGGAAAVELRARGRADAATIEVGAAPPRDDPAATGSVAPPRVLRASGRLDGGRLHVTVDGVARAYAVARDGDTLWLGRDGRAWAVREQGPVDAAAEAAAGAGGPVRSPMPGTVTVVEVGEGEAVRAGERLVVVEAMKMEHVLTAPVDGVVRELRVRAGATVAKDAVLLTVESTESAENTEKAGGP